LILSAMLVVAVVHASDVEVDVDAAANSSVEKSVLTYLNLARTHPSKFAAKLVSDVVPKYSGKIYHSPTAGDIMTNEGLKAVKQAIAVLRKTLPMPALTWSRGLNRATAVHAIDEGTKGLFSHTGSDGSSPWKRMARFGRFIGQAAENMGSGYDNGFEIVAQLIIDDGVLDRGHRKNILNPLLRAVGISVKPHKVYSWICVQDFATVFISKK